MLYETAWLLRRVRALYGVDILEYLMCITFWASRPIELYQQASRYSVISTGFQWKSTYILWTIPRLVPHGCTMVPVDGVREKGLHGTPYIINITTPLDEI